MVIPILKALNTRDTNSCLQKWSPFEKMLAKSPGISIHLQSTLCMMQLILVLTPILLNNLISHTHFWLSANQITPYNVFVQIHKMNDKQCRSWSGSILFAKVGVVVNSRIMVKKSDTYPNQVKISLFTAECHIWFQKLVQALQKVHKIRGDNSYKRLTNAIFIIDCSLSHHMN